MPNIKVKITIFLKSGLIFNYLKNRYDNEIYKNASMQSKGYIPKISCLKEIQNRELHFQVPARDVISNTFFSNWKWGYVLKEISENETEIEIYYKWNILLTIFSMFTIRHQAGNELVETVMALNALGLYNSN